MAHPVHSLEEFMDRQGDAIVAVTKAERSYYSGQWHRTEPGCDRIDADNSISYSPEVLRPLQELFDNPGKQHSEETLRAMARALEIVAHENLHGTESSRRAPANAHNNAQQRTGVSGTAMYVVKEAGTTLGARDVWRAFGAELGVDELAPGVLDVENEPQRPGQVPAVEMVLHKVSEMSGRDYDTTRAEFSVLDPVDKVELLSELAISGSSFDHDVAEFGEPRASLLRTQARDQVWMQMAGPLSRLETVNDNHPEAAKVSAEAGAAAIHAITQYVEKQLPVAVAEARRRIEHAALHDARMAAMDQQNQLLQAMFDAEDAARAAGGARPASEGGPQPVAVDARASAETRLAMSVAGVGRQGVSRQSPPGGTGARPAGAPPISAHRPSSHEL